MSAYMDDLINAMVYPDYFDVLFRRQGWLSFDYVRPEKGDPARLSQRWVNSARKSYSPSAFFDLFGLNTFRKLLGHIYSHSPCARSDLMRICGNETIVDEHLMFMEDQELAERENALWRKATRYQQVNNIGRTLEWYVAEWFKAVLRAPARYGVHVDDLVEGGDLDVVAFVDGLRISVECKSGRDITKRQLRLFAQRAIDFSPDLAILLIDTEADFERYIEVLNSVRKNGDPLSRQDSQGIVYWGMRNIYVTNTKKSIGHSLAAVLRLYHSRIKYLSFFAG